MALDESGIIADEVTTNGGASATGGFGECVDSNCSAATRADCGDDDNSSDDMSFYYFETI